MSSVIKPVLLDETGKEMLSAMRTQAAFLSAIARKSINEMTSWKDIQSLVRQGFAKDVFHIGDQFIVPWTDYKTEGNPVTYQVPLDVVHFDNVELKDGSIVPAMFLQWHYAIPFDVQFDAAETVRATGTFSSDYWYYDANNNNKLLTPNVDYVIGTNIPTDKVYYVSAIKDTSGQICRYGYSNWAHSGLRQFLNTDGLAGNWWTAQHVGDTAPEIANIKNGFLRGFDDDFRSVIGPIKILTAGNGAIDTGLGTTYDTFFIPSIEQLYFEPRLASEGGYFEYWKRATESPVPNNIITDELHPSYVVYDIAAQRTPCAVFTRTQYSSQFNSYPYNLWRIFYKNNGNATSGAAQANNSLRCTPVCAIY